VTDAEQSAEQHRFEHHSETAIELAATPDQVWEAIATAEGISAWMVPTRLDPRVGGEVTFDQGGFQSHGVVTGYTPGQRFAYEEPWPMTDSMRAWVDEISDHEVTDADLSAVGPIATEFLIEATSGGSCVLRIVSSSYGNGADWEHEFFSEMVGGWGPVPFGPDEDEPWLDRLAKHLGVAATRLGAAR
jgi:uncharacterized protein YndB with AHSA1/START domain